MLNQAIELTKRAHYGQVDQANKPYINHPFRVMNENRLFPAVYQVNSEEKSGLKEYQQQKNLL